MCTFNIIIICNIIINFRYSFQPGEYTSQWRLTICCGNVLFFYQTECLWKGTSMLLGAIVGLHLLNLNYSLLPRFSQAKKCSNEGRALMQVDFQQFRTQMEKMSNIRYILLGCP